MGTTYNICLGTTYNICLGTTYNICPIELKNNNFDKENFETLLNRKRGQKFRIENDKLTKISGLQKISFFFSKLFKTKAFVENQRKIKELISKNVNCISEKTNIKSLKAIFFDILSPLSSLIYDRQSIDKEILVKLKKEFEKEEDYERLTQKEKFISKKFLGLIQYIPSANKRKNENLQEAKKMLLDSKLALKLGIKPIKPSSGYSETYLIKGLDQKIIGVFKTAKGDSLSLNAVHPLMWIRNISPLGRRNARYYGGKCYIAESLSHEIDEEIETNLVPPTIITSLNTDTSCSDKKTEKGSLQKFVSHTIEAKDFLNMKKDYKTKIIKINSNTANSILPEELLDDLLILDIVTGNMDRHTENWLIKAMSIDENTKIATNIMYAIGRFSTPKSKRASTS